MIMVQHGHSVTPRRGAYYNDNDDYCCRWIENLIRAGHIATGTVDNRSISEVRPNDLRGYTQCHFFAGIGVWSYALRLAGWPDDRPVWTGSCPCQPFSGAGARTGFADERHLWPVFFDLIRECRPGVILGEQVASKDGLGWWDLVSSDLENADYPCAAIDTCVPGVGGPHIRQRLYWMAYCQSQRWAARRLSGASWDISRELAGQCDAGGLAYDHRVTRGQGRPVDSGRRQGGPAQPWSGSGGRGEPVRLGHAEGQPGRLPDGSGRLADPQSIGPGEAGRMGNSQRISTGWDTGTGVDPQGEARMRAECDLAGSSGSTGRTGPLNGFWRNADWLGCIDAKWRPVEPGTFPLAHGVAARVGRLRAYVNAINAKQAQQFIETVMECCP